MSLPSPPPSLDEFVAAAETFLGVHAKPRSPVAFRWGVGSDRIGVFPERTLEEDHLDLGAARAWRRTVFEAGFGWITGPIEHGGRGLETPYQRAYDDIERDYVVPSTSVFGITYGMVAPTILGFGTEHCKRSYLAGLYRGDVLGCQLFSEPGAGSDVASLTTRAVRDGDEWVISGQKVWTSGAHLADIGLLLARTDPEKPKHRGLTMFVVDMRAKGVDVRPLRQMTGGASFNEVFFSEVRVPDALRLGAVDDGWGVAIATLMHERAFVSSMNRASPVTLVRALVAECGASFDPVVRQRLAEIYTNARVAQLTSDRANAKLRAGQLPGPEMSVGKLALTNNLQRVAALAGQVLGPAMIADTGRWGTYAWSELVLSVPGVRLGGGTDEIQRNIVAERVLGLPKEPK